MLSNPDFFRRVQEFDDDTATEVADTHDLGEDNDSYDIVIGHRFISHVADPEGLIRRATRVLRPGDGQPDFAASMPRSPFRPAISASRRRSSRLFVWRTASS